MKKIDDHRYQAEESMTFVHKTSGIRMGNRMYLAETDNIDNYTEESMTEEEKAELEKENAQVKERAKDSRNERIIRKRNHETR